MPIQSQQQRKFLWAVHPDIAKRWEKETPKKKLPKYKSPTHLHDYLKKNQSK
jgi:hypothetical protein